MKGLSFATLNHEVKVQVQGARCKVHGPWSIVHTRNITRYPGPGAHSAEGDAQISHIVCVSGVPEFFSQSLIWRDQ